MIHKRGPVDEERLTGAKSVTKVSPPHPQKAKREKGTAKGKRLSLTPTSAAPVVSTLLFLLGSAALTLCLSHCLRSLPCFEDSLCMAACVCARGCVRSQRRRKTTTATTASTTARMARSRACSVHDCSLLVTCLFLALLSTPSTGAQYNNVPGFAPGEAQPASFELLQVQSLTDVSVAEIDDDDDDDDGNADDRNAAGSRRKFRGSAQAERTTAYVLAAVLRVPLPQNTELSVPLDEFNTWQHRSGGRATEKGRATSGSTLPIAAASANQLRDLARLECRGRDDEPAVWTVPSIPHGGGEPEWFCSLVFCFLVVGGGGARGWLNRSSCDARFLSCGRRQRRGLSHAARHRRSHVLVARAALSPRRARWKSCRCRCCRCWRRTCVGRRQT